MKLSVAEREGKGDKGISGEQQARGSRPSCPFSLARGLPPNFLGPFFPFERLARSVKNAALFALKDRFAAHNKSLVKLLLLFTGRNRPGTTKYNSLRPVDHNTCTAIQSKLH